MRDYLSNHSGLLPYQVDHTEHLLNVIRQKRRALDASDMGTGKTYIATALVRELGLPTLVVSPKSNVLKWERVGDAMGGEVTAINYERLTRTKTPFGSWVTDRGVTRWKWDEAVRFVVFDEAHRCGGAKTLQHKLMVACRHQDLHGIALSATSAENPTRMKALGYFLDLFGGGTYHKAMMTPKGPVMREVASTAVAEPFYQWACRYGCRDGWSGWGFYGDEEDMQRLHRSIFPDHGSRLRIADLPGFPETHVSVELIDMDDSGALQRRYSEMDRELSELKDRTADWNPEDGMRCALKGRQEIDLLKVPVYVSLAQDTIDNERSPVFFVPYRATLEALVDRLEKRGIRCTRIWGGQSAGERQRNLDSFEADEARAAVVVNQAGGEAIGLGDVRGEFPRAAFIAPPYEAWLLRQILGRVRRADSKSKSIQKILCALGTYEERIFERLVEKSRNLSALNDGTIDPDAIEDSDLNPLVST